MQSFTLPTGRAMPALGLGTFKLTGDTCFQAVRTALALGYRHIDTAAMYGNHREVGRAINQAFSDGVDRSELFITTKVSRDELAYDDVLAACDRALRELRLEYIDLYLIHWPNNDVPLEETFRAFQKLIETGKTRHVGVSNFTRSRLARAIAASDVRIPNPNPIPIACNQVEYHPYLNQEALLADCRPNGIVLTAYCPLARGKVITDKRLQRIAEAHGKSAAQVTLRWLVQKGIAVIPKASSEAHIRANMDIFDWELSAHEMKHIDAITQAKKERLIDWEIGEFDDERD